jgi:hypothetical protein
VAAERGTSVSGLVARELEQLVARNGRYEEAMRAGGASGPAAGDRRPVKVSGHR